MSLEPSVLHKLDPDAPQRDTRTCTPGPNTRTTSSVTFLMPDRLKRRKPDIRANDAMPAFVSPAHESKVISSTDDIVLSISGVRSVVRL